MKSKTRKQQQQMLSSAHIHLLNSLNKPRSTRASRITYYRYTDSQVPRRSQLILGHETSGTVVGVGKKVKGFAVGDRVAIEPGVPCRYCFYCKTGRYNLCPDAKFFATPPTDGSLTRYLAYDADFCYK
ncbi:GroES-like protein [Cooperia oncophora]